MLLESECVLVLEKLSSLLKEKGLEEKGLEEKGLEEKGLKEKGLVKEKGKGLVKEEK